MEQKRIEAKQQLEEKKGELEQRRAEFKQRLTEKREAVIIAYAERMVKRLHAALDRLTGIADRIISRIEKLGDKFDTTTALANTEEARLQIEFLHIYVDETLAGMQNAFDDEDPQTSFENVRITIKEIVSEIKNVHKLLIEAITSLKAQVTVDDPDESDEDTDSDGDTDDESGDEEGEEADENNN